MQCFRINLYVIMCKRLCVIYFLHFIRRGCPSSAEVIEDTEDFIQIQISLEFFWFDRFFLFKFERFSYSRFQRYLKQRFEHIFNGFLHFAILTLGNTCTLPKCTFQYMHFPTPAHCSTCTLQHVHLKHVYFKVFRDLLNRGLKRFFNLWLKHFFN